VKAKTARILDRLTPYANATRSPEVGDDHVERTRACPKLARDAADLSNVDAGSRNLEESRPRCPRFSTKVRRRDRERSYRPTCRVNSTRV